MWEKSEEDSQKQNQKNNNARNVLFPHTQCKKNADENKGVLLLIQIIVCISMVLIIYLLSKYSTNNVQVKKYTNMLINNNQTIQSDEDFARLVSTFFENISVNSQENEQTSKGGMMAVKSKNITPKNCRFEKYSLPILIAVPVEGYVTSCFGFRQNPVTGKNDFHTGLDIAAPKNTPINAALQGVVTKAGYDKIRGNYIFVKYSDTLILQYNHLNLKFVKIGETVKQGDILGSVGSTGMSTGSHLHFEIISNGKYVNPYNVLNLPAKDQL